MRELTKTENVPYKEASPTHFKSLCATYGVFESDFAPMRVACTLSQGKVPKKAYYRLLEIISKLEHRPYLMTDRMPDRRRKQPRTYGGFNKTQLRALMVSARITWPKLAEAMGTNGNALRMRVARGEMPVEAKQILLKKIKTEKLKLYREATAFQAELDAI